MDSKPSARRWFRFNLRKLLIAVCVVALSFVAVPTAMHLWAWPEAAERERSVILFLRGEANELQKDEALSAATSGDLHAWVGSLRDENGNRIPPNEKFALKLYTRDRRLGETIECHGVGEAMRRIRYHHWREQVASGQRMVADWLRD